MGLITSVRETFTGAKKQERAPIQGVVFYSSWAEQNVYTVEGAIQKTTGPSAGKRELQWALDPKNYEAANALFGGAKFIIFPGTRKGNEVSVLIRHEDRAGKPNFVKSSFSLKETLWDDGCAVAIRS
ncbi:MAG: hypothetical protein RLZZ283_140 [Candidatus Parcubacteria bacterium]|jgi:hypothetical protein